MCQCGKRKKKLINEPDENELLVSLGSQFEKTNINTNYSQEIKVVNAVQNGSMNARYVWGTLVANLRRLNMMTLHTACGEIRDVEFFSNTLTVKIKEEYLYNILKREESYKQILNLLKQINKDIELNFVLQKRQEDKIKVNLERLKSVFGSDLIIK